MMNRNLKKLKGLILKVIRVIFRFVKSLFTWKTLERLKLILEIFAIPIAAYWAYTLFIESDAPSLMPRSNLSSEIIWTNKTDKSCQGELKIEFQNIGKKSLDIGKAHITSWYLGSSPELNQSEKFKMIEPRNLRQGNPLFDEDTNILEYIYPPDEKVTNTVVFVVNRLEKKQILFTVAMWRREDLSNDSANWAYDTWDWACGENPYEKEK